MNNSVLDVKLANIQVLKSNICIDRIICESELMMEDHELSYMENNMDISELEMMCESVISDMVVKVKEFIAKLIEQIRIFFKQMQIKINTLSINTKMLANANKLAEILKLHPLHRNDMVTVPTMEAMTQFAQLAYIKTSKRLAKGIASPSLKTKDQLDLIAMSIPEFELDNMVNVPFGKDNKPLYQAVLELQVKSASVTKDIEKIETVVNKIYDNINIQVDMCKKLSDMPNLKVSDRLKALKDISVFISKVTIMIESNTILYINTLYAQVVNEFVRRRLIGEGSSWDHGFNN